MIEIRLFREGDNLHSCISRNCKVADNHGKGPFKYYVIKRVGGVGQMIILYAEITWFISEV